MNGIIRVLLFGAEEEKSGSARGSRCACTSLLDSFAEEHVVPVAWAMVTNFLVISVVGCELRKSDFIKIYFRTKVRMEELL